MSELAPQTGQSGQSYPFQTVQEAGLVELNPLLLSELERNLETNRVVAIPIELSATDFITLSQGYEICLEEYPELLTQTTHKVDPRFGNDAGHVRKERGIDPQTGLQIQDPKNIFHFNEQARLQWQEQFAITPVEFRQFLEAGYEIHDAMLTSARTAVAELEESHPGLTAAHFPARNLSVSFLRVVSYDSYENDSKLASIPVAKPHIDISTYTLQGWSSAPGFWGRTAEGKTYLEDQEGLGYFFAAATHRAIYGKDSRIKPLIHGVDRITPAGIALVPKRHSVILFLDPWNIDADIQPTDTDGY